MLITLLATQSLWMIYQERQQRRLASSLPGSAIDTNTPFWLSVLARYRKQIKLAGVRRDRTRRAVERLSRTSARKVRTDAQRS